MFELSLIAPQYPGVPSRANIVNVQPTEPAKPGINFFIGSKHVHSVRSLSKFLYLIYDENSRRYPHYSISDVVRETFPDAGELRERDIDSAMDLGYNVIARSRCGDYGYRMYGEYAVPQSGHSAHVTIPLIYVLMKTLSVMSWTVRDLIETRQPTFDGIESEQQIALGCGLYARLGEVRSRHNHGLPHLSNVQVRTPEESVSVSLTVDRFPAQEQMNVEVKMHRDTPTLWTVSSDRPELLNLLLDTAIFAYPQLSRFSDALTKPHFYLDESVILTIEP